MQLRVNGEYQQLADALALDAALQALGYDCEQVVVAVNETFVPKEQWAQCLLQADDCLDVLAPIVGG